MLDEIGVVYKLTRMEILIAPLLATPPSYSGLVYQCHWPQRTQRLEVKWSCSPHISRVPYLWTPLEKTLTTLFVSMSSDIPGLRFLNLLCCSRISGTTTDGHGCISRFLMLDLARLFSKLPCNSSQVGLGYISRASTHVAVYRTVSGIRVSSC